MEKALVMNSEDNVATAITELKRGETVSVLVGSERRDVKLADDIPFGHKFAIKPVEHGGTVLKYGQSIGISVSTINVGQHIHIHNLKSSRGGLK